MVCQTAACLLDLVDQEKMVGVGQLIHPACLRCDLRSPNLLGVVTPGGVLGGVFEGRDRGGG